MFQNHYKTLGINYQVANQIIGNFFNETQIKELIHSSWKKQAILNHPDKGGDVQLMKYINQAKDCLILKETRQKYNSSYLLQLVAKLDTVYPITHVIGRKKYHIPNPDKTGDGSITNMFLSTTKRTPMYDRIIIS